MIVKKLDVDYFWDGWTTVSGKKPDSFALTLDPEDLGTHKDGWTIVGEVVTDYYSWVNEFEATHPVYGRVYGNFEYEVYADSEEGFAHFWEHHRPCEWDYWDI